MSDMDGYGLEARGGSVLRPFRGATNFIEENLWKRGDRVAGGTGGRRVA